MLKMIFPLVVGALASLFVYVIWLWVQKLQGSVGAIVLRGVVFGVWASIAAIVIFTIYMGAKYPGGIALDVRGPAWMPLPQEVTDAIAACPGPRYPFLVWEWETEVGSN
jgi:hypothetical protein